MALEYDSLRYHEEERVSDSLLKNKRAKDFVNVSLARCLGRYPHVVYTLDVVDIYPGLPQHCP